MTNAAPVGVLGTYSVLHGHSIDNLSLTGNDADGDWTSVSTVDQPDHGYVWQNWYTGTWSYYGNSDFAGPDSFTYKVYSGEATVSIEVTNAAPVAVDDIFSTPQGQSLSNLNLKANDSDADQDWLNVQIQDGPDHGYLSYDWMSGTYTYTPTTGYAGTDSFT